jgi:RHS repeat-associated protein
MTGITYPDSSLNTFAYDGDGKRLQKQDSSGTLRMVYDHQGPTGLYDLAKETDGSNTLVAFYTQGPMLISQRRGGNSYWYHDDALGSTSAITSSDETVTSTYKYYAFGDVLTSSGTLTNAFKYVGGLGYYSDPDSGLLLLRARYYWPGIARFLSRDATSAGRLYAYAHNNPIVFTDPEGLHVFEVGSIVWEKSILGFYYWGDWWYITYWLGDVGESQDKAKKAYCLGKRVFSLRKIPDEIVPGLPLKSMYIAEFAGFSGTPPYGITKVEYYHHKHVYLADDLFYRVWLERAQAIFPAWADLSYTVLHELAHFYYRGNKVGLDEEDWVDDHLETPLQNALNDALKKEAPKSHLSCCKFDDFTAPITSYLDWAACSCKIRYVPAHKR